VYHPARPRYVYYYTPFQGPYWGRYDLRTCGYSLLAPEDRKALIGDIPEAAFPPPGRMPPPEEGIDEPMPPPPEVLGGAGNAPALPPASGAPGYHRRYRGVRQG
jgi:hypothetical protein